MGLHNGYLVALGALFAPLLAVALASLRRQQRAERHAGAAAGNAQQLWATLPFAIVYAVGYALVDRNETAAPVLALASATTIAAHGNPASAAATTARQPVP